MVVDSSTRIIPARAGFTYSWNGTLEFRGDHPRSRGVYQTTFPESNATWGSSPLARGLPPPENGCEWGIRIIPARAGFTIRAIITNNGTTDHPRSRGVYHMTAKDI